MNRRGNFGGTSGGPANDVTFTSAPPAKIFTFGVAETYDVRPYVSGFNANVHEFTITSGSNSGISANPTTGVNYDGVGAVFSATPYNITIVNNNRALSDWRARSTAAGVVQAVDFTGANDFVSGATNGGHVYANAFDAGIMAQVVKDVTDGPTGTCLRIDTPAAYGANSAAWMGPLNASWTTNSQNFGSSEFYIQFRFKIPASRLVLSDCGGNQRGWKFFDIGQYSSTNTGGESFSHVDATHVMQDTGQRGLPQAYSYDTSALAQPWQDDINGGADITLQDTDRGSGTDANRYCLYPSGTPGCEFFYTDEWLTFKIRLKISTYNGSTGNEADIWMLRWGATTPVKIFERRGYSVGDPNSLGGGYSGLTGFHCNAYETNRVANSGSNIATHQKWAQIIVSTQDIAWPAVGC